MFLRVATGLACIVMKHRIFRTGTTCKRPNCRYGILIRSSTTSFDSGKSNNLNFMKWWPEGSLVGCVVDTWGRRQRGSPVPLLYMDSNT